MAVRSYAEAINVIKHHQWQYEVTVACSGPSRLKNITSKYSTMWLYNSCSEYQIITQGAIYKAILGNCQNIAHNFILKFVLCPITILSLVLTWFPQA